MTFTMKRSSCIATLITRSPPRTSTPLFTVEAVEEGGQVAGNTLAAIPLSGNTMATCFPFMASGGDFRADEAASDDDESPFFLSELSRSRE